MCKGTKKANESVTNAPAAEIIVLKSNKENSSFMSIKV
jgi:hypothetical protein